MQSSLLQTYRLGILPIPTKNSELKNKLLAEINNFPLILQNISDSTGSFGFQWMTMDTVGSNTASGVGQNDITVSITQTGGGMFDNGLIFRAETFPVEYGVPIGSRKSIANQNAGIFTATFSQPVKDPLVAFASVGRPSTYVPVSASLPFTPIWGIDTTYQNPVSTNQYTQFTGNEGFNIIRLDGTLTSISFNYSVDEYYCNILFGFVDQNN
jgi:hypothetical protein